MAENRAVAYWTARLYRGPIRGARTIHSFSSIGEEWVSSGFIYPWDDQGTKELSAIFTVLRLAIID